MPRQQLISLRRGTAAQWAAANPVLALGEPGFETDTGAIRVGDGVTAWTALAAAGLPFTQFPFTSSDFMADPAATLVAPSNVPGWQFADAATQGISTSFTLPASWRSVSLVMVWANLSAAAGDVRWQVQMKNINLFSDLITEAPAVDQLLTATAGAQNVPIFATPFSGASVPEGAFGSLRTLRIVRLGADALDTLAGAVYVPSVVFVRAG